MRSFLGSDGREWEVVVGRESWGALFAIFMARKGQDPPRQTMLEGTSVDEALRTILSMEEEELRALLERSCPKAME